MSLDTNTTGIHVHYHAHSMQGLPGATLACMLPAETMKCLEEGPAEVQLEPASMQIMG